MSSALHYDHLAGATLDNISIDWRNGTALITFLPSPKMSESCTLRAEGLLKVDLARSATASHAVSKVQHTHGVVTIALTSGESLRLEATSLTLVGTGG